MRLALVYPLNCHFVAAESSLSSAEMTHVQRFAPVYPPLCKFCSCMAEAREEAAEYAKSNPKNLTQSRKGIKTQRVGQKLAVEQSNE